MTPKPEPRRYTPMCDFATAARYLEAEIERAGGIVDPFARLDEVSRLKHRALKLEAALNAEVFLNRLQGLPTV